MDEKVDMVQPLNALIQCLYGVMRPMFFSVLIAHFWTELHSRLTVVLLDSVDWVRAFRPHHL